MKALFSAGSMQVLTFVFFLSACDTDTPDPANVTIDHADTVPAAKPSPSGRNMVGNEKAELTRIYTQAIGDYIRLINDAYDLRFDTLFFGKHVNGQDTDFPDIDLPAVIENTAIQVISPEQGSVIQEENESSYYINLIGSVNADDANFIFVAFSNGFAHQFDCFLDYSIYRVEQRNVLQASRFENYQYLKR